MTTVAVLAGGRSPEHDVSIQSGTQVLRHLGPEFEVWPVYLDRGGRWWTASAPVPPPRAVQGFRVPGMEPRSPGAALDHLIDAAAVDAVFPVLHGRHGEDGTVQGMLELHGVPFVGAGCAASAAAMDKIRTRECLAFHGVPMAPAYLPSVPLARADAAAEGAAIAASVGFPCFLKVDQSGSTLGVARADGPADVAAFLSECRGMGRRFLAEAAVAGEEITVGVLGNSGDELQALPPVGIYPRRDRYFTYAAKYDAEACEEVVPPRGLSADSLGAAQALAKTCHTALQCDGMSRVDMIVGPGGPVVLEVNTIPGLTEVSLLPRAAAAAGLSFRALLARLVELALQRPRLAEVA
jgi:D-alanine-D-alanine ligase